MPSAGELAALYNRPDYYDSARSRAGAVEANARRRLRTTQRFWPWGARRGRLLEVGCATGEFLAAARAEGWQVEGVEVGASLAQATRDRTGIPVHVGFLEDFEDPDGFDVVVAWEVVEHVVEPARFLRRLVSLLRPGGMLGLSTPNTACWQARLLGARFPMLPPPEHLHYFRLPTLRSWARSEGLGCLGYTSSSQLDARAVQRGLDRFVFLRSPNERVRLSGRGVHLSLKWAFSLLDLLGWGTQLEAFFLKAAERHHAA